MNAEAVQNVIAAMPPHVRMAAALLTPEKQAEAVAIYARKAKMSAEKLAALMLAENPHAVLNDGDEALVRGLHPETLKAYKSDGWLPDLFRGSHPASPQ